MISAMLFGLLIGMRHALEADHVAAVAALSIRAKSTRKRVWHGVVWGLGHTLTLFAVGTFVILSNAVVPPYIAQALEASVGLMLILLGLDIARRMIRDRVHFHVHQHRNDVPHIHAHSHRGEPKGTHDAAAHEHAHAANFSARALFVGLMHGLAGSAALIVLTLESTYSIAQGLFYMAVFGLGSMAGMALLSLAMSVPLQRAGTRFTWLHRGMETFVGVVNVGLGTFLIVTALSASS